ncbi:MAG: hypothetical protein VKJ46_13105 [Leptolyngbyaceae bacterium]|nr:hypothetical protein [Leptolyngbyaceae bacterium]
MLDVKSLSGNPSMSFPLGFEQPERLVVCHQKWDQRRCPSLWTGTAEVAAGTKHDFQRDLF